MFHVSVSYLIWLHMHFEPQQTLSEQGVKNINDASIREPHVTQPAFQICTSDACCRLSCCQDPTLNCCNTVNRVTRGRNRQEDMIEKEMELVNVVVMRWIHVPVQRRT